MRVLCEWMRGETNDTYAPVRSRPKVAACLPACLSSESATTYTYVGTQLSQLSQPAHKREQKVGYN